MNVTNLIPLSRQLRAARVSRSRGWAVACAATTALCAAAYVAMATTAAPAAAPAPAALSVAARDLSQWDAKVREAKARLERTDREINAARLFSERPDLSVLLKVVARAAEDQIVLSRCELTSSDSRDAAKTAQPAAGGPVVLRLDGYGRTQSAVAAFVLQLETAGPFDRVTLVQSRREPLADLEATGFRVDCAIEPAQKGTP